MADPSAAGTAGAAGAGAAGTAGPNQQPSPEPMMPAPMEATSQPAPAVALAEAAPGIHRITLGARALEVDVTQGARVIAFELEGRNVLRPLERANGFLNGGSTLWTSPQSDWSWPPLPAHDEGAYQASVEGAALLAVGAAADVAGTRVAVTKRFTGEPASGAMRIDYTLRNGGDAAAPLSPWEVSRHPTGGLTFWPGAAARGDFAPREVGGHLWLSYDELWSGSDGKVFADASAGWMAHAQDGLLVVRTWADVPAAQQAPGEAEVEVYLAASYVELELQGPYGEIAAGAEAGWTVRWYVLPIPPGTDVSPGSAALVELAQSVR